MTHKVVAFKEAASNIASQIEKLLTEGWKIDRADVVGKLIIYVFYKK